MGLERIPGFSASIAAIGEDMPQPGKVKAHCLEHIGRPVTVLNVSGVHQNEDQKSAGVGEKVALAAPDLLARVPRVWLRQPEDRLRPKPPPLSVVLTLWLSITPIVSQMVV